MEPLSNQTVEIATTVFQTSLVLATLWIGIAEYVAKRASDETLDKGITAIFWYSVLTGTFALLFVALYHSASVLAGATSPESVLRLALDAILLFMIFSGIGLTTHLRWRLQTDDTSVLLIVNQIAIFVVVIWLIL